LTANVIRSAKDAGTVNASNHPEADVAYIFPTFSSVIGARKPVQESVKGYDKWSDSLAILAISLAGHGAPIDGDLVTIYDDDQTTSKYFLNGDWVSDSDYIQALQKAGEALIIDSRPGIADEIKPELKIKRLRDW
jgi:hypothetical protein